MNSIPLLLPLSLIDKNRTGFLNNVSLVVQNADNYAGLTTAELHYYSSYPIDYFDVRPNPINDVSEICAF